MEDLTGRRFGQYQIVAPLGEGGMAAVYKAHQPAMERHVAIKVLPRHMSTSEEFLARFRREARMLAQLQHPHILPVFDYGEADGYPYIVMPFLSSGTLAELLHKQRLPLAQVRRILTQLGDAISYAHTRGMIHRDIKPSNVLIDERGNCLLTDFGLARMAEVSTNITSSGAIMGTPAYMSPEQGSGSDIDHRSDIYSLGIVLYEMVTGRVPYTAETPVAVVFKHIQDPLPSIHKFNPDLPDSVELILRKALAKSPEDRYQTAEDFVRSIQTAIPVSSSEHQEPAQQPYPLKTTITPEKNQPLYRWILPVGILTLVFIVAVGGFWASTQRIAPIPPSPTSFASTVFTTALATTSAVATTETQTPLDTSVPTTIIPAPDRLSEFLNEVQILSSETFDNQLESGWNIANGTLENGVMELIGNADWSFSYWNGSFGVNEGMVIEFNYSDLSLSEIFLEYGVWNTDEYKRFGVYIGGDQAKLNEYRGGEDQDYGGVNLSGNLTLQSGTTYSLLIAVLPNGEFLEVIWDPNSSETLSHRETIDESWDGLTWTLWIGVNQNAIQFDNFEKISFSSAK